MGASKQARKTGRRLIIGIVVGAIAIALAARQSGMGLREIHDQIAALGPWGPIAWSGLLLVLLPFMAPVSVATTLSGLAFGPVAGFGSAYVGVVGAGWISFGISRWMGKEWVERLLGAHTARLDQHVETHGLFGVLYLRMLPLPFIPISYLAGLTTLRFPPYALGTAIGIVPGVLVNSVVAGTVGEAWLANQGFAGLLQPRTYWAAAVVAASLIAPFAIEAGRRWRRAGALSAQLDQQEPEGAPPSDPA